MVGSAMAQALSGFFQARQSARLLAEGHDEITEAVDPSQLQLLPIADRANTAVAVGMAWGGRPVVLQISSVERLGASYEVLSEAASAAAQGVRCPLVLWAGAGVTQAAVRVPQGVDVLSPASARDLSAALEAAVASGRPTVILQPAGQGVSLGDAVVAEVVAGSGATVVVSGQQLPEVEAILREAGLGVQLVCLQQLSPLPPALAQMVQSTGRAVIVGAPDGLAGATARALTEQAFDYLEAPVMVSAPQALVRTLNSALHY